MTICSGHNQFFYHLVIFVISEQLAVFLHPYDLSDTCVSDPWVVYLKQKYKLYIVKTILRTVKRGKCIPQGVLPPRGSSQDFLCILHPTISPSDKQALMNRIVGAPLQKQTCFMRKCAVHPQILQLNQHPRVFPSSKSCNSKAEQQFMNC